MQPAVVVGKSVVAEAAGPAAAEALAAVDGAVLHSSCFQVVAST